jgi:hypothetical protein
VGGKEGLLFMSIFYNSYESVKARGEIRGEFVGVVRVAAQESPLFAGRGLSSGTLVASVIWSAIWHISFLNARSEASTDKIVVVVSLDQIAGKEIVDSIQS